MTRTLRFGFDSAAPRLQSRIGYVTRRRTHMGYDALMAADDFSRHVALEVSPKLARKTYVTFVPRSVPFGKR